MLLESILSLLLLIVCSGSDAFRLDQIFISENQSNSKHHHSSHMDASQSQSAPGSQHNVALQGQSRHAILYNRYAPLDDFHRAVGPQESLSRLHFPSAPGDIQADNLACFTRKHDCKQKDASFPPPQKASNGLSTHSTPDLASVLAIHILQALPGDSVLDLCAAEGNNSVILSQSLWPYLQPSSSGPPMPGAKKAILHSNEVDLSLNDRLSANLAQYLPASLNTSNLQKVLRVDGTKGVKDLPVVPGGYDKVLVDVSRYDKQHAAQVQLLLTALHAVRYGGRVLYSIASVSREENDAVVEAAIAQVKKEKEKGEVVWSVEGEVLDPAVQSGLQADWADKTEKGWLVRPDHAGSGKAGPLYLSLLTKKAA